MASRNPLKALAARTDLREEYVAPPSTLREQLIKEKGKAHDVLMFLVVSMAYVYSRKFWLSSFADCITNRALYDVRWPYAHYGIFLI